MKRSVIQLAGKTYVISLPAKWVKDYNIKKGDELEVSEEKDKLKISKDGLKTELKTEINLTGYSDDITRRIIGALYKKGYDEVKAHYDDTKQLNIIQKAADSGLIGFEIISNAKNHCILKMVANENEKDFSSVFRRLFYLLTGIGRDAIESLEPLNNEKLQEIISRDKTVNKLADYCRRMINKSKDENSHYNYSIAENLEKIGDEYRDMLRFICNQNIPIEKKIIKKFTEVNSYFDSLHEVVYNFNQGNISAFSEKNIVLRDEIAKLISDNKNNQRGITHQRINTRYFKCRHKLILQL